MRITTTFYFGARLARSGWGAGLFMAAVGGFPLASLRAGTLMDIYEAAIVADLNVEVAEYELRAAEQQIQTQRQQYFPRLFVIGRESFVEQDISATDTTIYREGITRFSNTLLNVEVSQPLYDPTIAPEVEAARARYRRQHNFNREMRELRTQRIVEGFLRTVRLYELSGSADRVIQRLQKELEGVSKSYDVKLATIADVQNVKLSLAGMKREKNNYVKQLHYELANLGVGGEVLKSSWVELSPEASLAEAVAAAAVETNSHPQQETLEAEIDELEHQITATQRRTWPVLSLFGRYELDNADGSVFGGARDITGYAAGVAVQWDIFNRGINRSEAKTFTYRKLAKERQLKVSQVQQEKSDRYRQELMNQSRRSVLELEDLVAQHAVLRDSSARAYEAGKQSYIESITAYLAYESTVREWENARYDRLLSEINFYGQSRGWNEAFVRQVDDLFEPAEGSLVFTSDLSAGPGPAFTRFQPDHVDRTDSHR
ncbi:TolC family protein [Synoicihabitans lomoniglobus]|uniref:TolC family protein n=1 Tax=Synoicihabitans lomoniglobus TaxID=2909285 RepID=A0AAF0CND1_9BACT|nr:TolC family protein [Opitutaceae bacterium LMO-M01]WED64431.1 TolC family protein [Opitutaceae bacterium LMO-M01]